MKELKLEHLAPYLPYGLKVQYNNGDDLNIVDEMIGIEDKSCILTSKHLVSLIAFKPILRHLSDLTKDIEHNGERFDPIQKCNDLLGINIMWSGWGDAINGDLSDISYSHMVKLIEWHFDVFGLIDADLAIDINTIK